MTSRKRKGKTIYPKSDHYDGKHFHNKHNTNFNVTPLIFLKFLYQILTSKKWPNHISDLAIPKFANNLSTQQTYITYINHACHLIQLKDLNILTDPIFSKRAGPLAFVGPKRVNDPGIKISELPPIHVVVISHNHYDHMDLPTLKKLETLYKPLFIVPLGNQKYLKHMTNVLELDWWQTHNINETQSITLVPAQHWSLRHLGDSHTALWGGYWIQSVDLKIYFVGDSGYAPLFKELQQKMGSPTISILPIGSYEPRWFMKNQHMNPEDVVLASQDLKSELNIGSHYHTFKLSSEEIEAPKYDLREMVAKYGMDQKNFVTPENGETIIFELNESQREPRD